MRYLQEKNLLFNFIMSQNRSVAAAQRRRAAPQQEYSAPQRSPATSIASAANFQQQQQQQYQQQMSGKMAGQYAAVQQKQYLNPPQEMNQNTAKELLQTNGVAKMTIPQAITLITLRLGRIENKIQDMEFQNLGQSGSSTSATDGDISGAENSFNNNSSMSEFNDRLTKLEESFGEFPQMKQQLEVYKPGIVSIKNVSTANSKEIALLKTQLIALQSETKMILTKMAELQTFGIGEAVDEEFVEEENIVAQTSIEELSKIDANNIKELVKNELKLDISEKTTPTFSGLNS